MSKIKFCGLRRLREIEWANEIKPDYIGFVFAKKSKRYIPPDEAMELRGRLKTRIEAVGVFVDEAIEIVANYLEMDIIELAQLHGNEDEEYIKSLKKLTDKPIIKAFRIDSIEDIERANNSSADMVLLDSGNGGTGTSFDWDLLKGMKRPYILAGGLDPEKVGAAIDALQPYAVDVSSGIENDGHKDKDKMLAFAAAVRERE